MTPQPNDFKAAIESTEAYQRSVNYTEGCGYEYKHKDGEEVMYKHNETIRFALRLAERVCGEPSEGMVKAMLEVEPTNDEGRMLPVIDILDFSGENGARTVVSAIAKAMISEALKEIEKS